MNESTTLGAVNLRSVVDTLPIGVVVYDEDRRLVLANPAYFHALGFPPGAFRPLSALADNARLLARSGLLGPGDPDAQAAAIANRDVTREHRSQRQRADGGRLESCTIPLPSGGHMVCVTDATARGAARAEADALVARAYAAIAGLRIGLAVFTPQRTLAMHNRRFSELLGVPPLAIADGMPFSDLLLAMQARGDFASLEGNLFLAGQLSQDRGHPAISRRRRADGLMIDIQSDPMADGGWTMTLSDVTALDAAQQDLAREAALLASIVNHIPHGIGVYGRDRRLRLVNDAYRAIMAGAPIAIGDTVDEIITRRAQAGEYGVGDQEQLARQQHLHDSGQPQMRRRQRPGGATIDIRTAPLPDGGHMSVVTDATPLVKAEAELAERAAAMDAMLGSIRHGIILWNHDRRIVAASPIVNTMLYAQPGVIVPGRTLEEVVATGLERGNLGCGATAQARAQWLLQQDRSQSHLDQRLTRDGRIIEVRSDPAPHGGFVTTYTDVTQLREAEDALRLSKAAAEAANAAKSRFLATMSAELRSPLTTILAQADIIARDAADQQARNRARGLPGTDAERLQDASDTIGTAARSLLGMIDTILDMARLEAGRFNLADDVVDLAQLVRACLRQFDPAAAAAEVALVVDLPERLPRLRADERRLRQALGHVLSNAVKFTDAGGSVDISARHDWTTGDLLIQVQNTGAGIAAADLERAFEPFTQLIPPSVHAVHLADDLRPAGAGLGLYVSRILLRAHGGELTLRSTPGAGVTAILHIPADRVLQDGATGPT